jgi:hypothetical protein
MSDYIKYSPGYKYQLEQDYTVVVDIKGEKVDSEYIKLSEDGTLFIKEGYAWDGPSGPTIDTLDSMRGSLIHDVLYQSMRDYGLDRLKYKSIADNEFRKACLEDGMSKFRAFYFYWGVRLFGAKSTSPEGDYPVVIAPKQDLTKILK